jgi:hypothetical protein
VIRVSRGLGAETVWLEMGIAGRGRAAAGERAVAGEERHRRTLTSSCWMLSARPTGRTR